MPIIEFATPADFADWLAKHHQASAGLWMKIAKKNSGSQTVTYSEALDVALCFGWIDGQKDRFDELYWLQRFTPRKPRSRWSKANRDRATALIENGRMGPMGLRAVERAKADGRWDTAYEGQKASTVPGDLKEALDQNPVAREFFSTLDSRNRYAVLYRLQNTRRPETRARKIGEFVAMLGERRKFHD
ncbi:MAG TPA: YdeI/OmpD-associated family protein [Mycobacteriales bacterium]|nr:YdeI/OmpD-associated family protein [Mycobacteriales bacterium]